MNRTLQSLLLWLMIVMMPVQGIAAVIKASCGPNHHHVAQVANEAEHHHHDGVAAHASSDSMFGTSMNAGDVRADSDSYKNAFCSACAACCSGAVGPPALVTLPSQQGSSESFVLAAASLVAGFIPAGLDRPPKSNFA